MTMGSGWLREWTRPVLGALVLLAGAGLLAYKVISDYRPATPNGFVAAGQQQAAVSKAAPEPAVVASAAILPPSSATADAPTVPAASAAPEEDRREGPCPGIDMEIKEIEAAMQRPYTAAEGNYMRRRLEELHGQSTVQHCG
jgi:hypothetical protein